MNTEKRTKVLVEHVFIINSDEVSDRRSGALRLGSVSMVSANEMAVNTDSKVNYSGAKVREWRKKSGLTMATLAADIGISEAYLSQIETGKRQGTISTYQKIAQVMNIPVSVLI